MLDNRRRASGANIMPNAYRVGLSAEDFATIVSYQASLTRRLESWLADRAEVHDGTLLDRIDVALEEDDRARLRRPIVKATITDVSQASAASQNRSRPSTPQGRQHTEVFSSPVSGTCELRLLTGPNAGTSYTIPTGQSHLGRSSDVEIRLDANDVSRRHLQLERHGEHVRITDLDSTNGTQVNGEPVRHATLRHGDEIRVGTQVLRFLSS